MKKTIILVVIWLSMIPYLNSQTENQTNNQTIEDLQKISADYLNHYCNLEVQQLADYYTEESIWEDPTTSHFGPDFNGKVVGKENILSFLTEQLNSLSYLKVKYTGRFFAGEYAVYQGVWSSKLDGKQVGSQRKLVKIQMPFVVILRIKDGKVIHHQDYADYTTYQMQVMKQMK